MKMLSDGLLIGHNWPIIGRFLSNYSKNQLVNPNVLYSFDGYQKNSIDSNISGKKKFSSIEHSHFELLLF